MTQTKNSNSFPTEFLDALQDHITEALKKCLGESNVPSAAQDLLEDMQMLMIWRNHDDKNNGHETLSEIVASATQHIAACGGSFYGPHGEIKRTK